MNTLKGQSVTLQPNSMAGKIRAILDAYPEYSDEKIARMLKGEKFGYEKRTALVYGEDVRRVRSKFKYPKADKAGVDRYDPSRRAISTPPILFDMVVYFGWTN